MNKSDKKLNVKRTITIFVLALVVFIIGFCFVIWAAIMQDNGISTKIIGTISMIGLIGCSIISIIVIVKIFPDLVMMDVMKIKKVYDNSELTELQLTDMSAMDKTLLTYKFKYTEDGYYKRKKLSLVKDTISYYVRMTEGIDIIKSVQREKQIFSKVNRGRNVCLLLLIYFDTIDNSAKLLFKQSLKKRFIIENVDLYSCSSTIVIAVEKSTGKGYFLDINKRMSIALYAYGCRMIKRIERAIINTCNYS